MKKNKFIPFLFLFLLIIPNLTWNLTFAHTNKNNFNFNQVKQKLDFLNKYSKEDVVFATFKFEDLLSEIYKDLSHLVDIEIKNLKKSKTKSDKNFIIQELKIYKNSLKKEIREYKGASNQTKLEIKKGICIKLNQLWKLIQECEENF